jgi:transglutaminase-like putative cysteine protease
MIYDVRQTTAYTYASTVGFAQHVLRLTPIDRPHQRVYAAALDISPPPADRREAQDFFGNRMTRIAHVTAHDRLVVKVAARVAVERRDDPVASTTPAWEVIRDQVFASNDLGAQSPVHFVFPSRLVSLSHDIRGYTAESFPPARPVLGGAVELMRRIKADFTYEVGSTDVSTTPDAAFALRRGVCQDFAHIMIAGLRGLGVPAAYVSGYLRTVPPPGAAHLTGADAMHAWVLAWCGASVGWCGLDPTNGVLSGEDHVVLAIGRDYADVAPIEGVVFASGTQQLEVAVEVIPVLE